MITGLTDNVLSTHIVSKRPALVGRAVLQEACVRSTHSISHNFALVRPAGHTRLVREHWTKNALERHHMAARVNCVEGVAVARPVPIGKLELILIVTSAERSSQPVDADSLRLLRVPMCLLYFANQARVHV